MLAKFVIAGFLTADNGMKAIHPRHDELSLEVQGAGGHAPNEGRQEIEAGST